MRKEIKVQVNRHFGTAGLLPGLPNEALWQCNVLTTFLWIGILTAPPRYRGFDLSTFWAWLRYASAVSERDTGLRLKPIWSEIDPHQKTIMSDDFGMGFACHYLAEQHGVQAFANTAYLLDSLVGVTALRPGKRGPAKSPDFIATDARCRLHILECKGTQTSAEYLLSALKSGIDQKNNFSNGSPFTSSMVGGIFVPQHSNPEDAVLMYIDPKPDARLMQLSELPVEVIEQGIYRISLAKELMAAGLWRTASNVERRGRVSALSVEELTVDDELPIAGFGRADGGWTRTMQYRSIEIDPAHFTRGEVAKEYSRRTTLKVEVADEVLNFAREVLLMDEGGAKEEADRLILRRARERRRERVVQIRSRTSERATFRTRVHKFQSSWFEQVLTPTSASLAGPSGVTFSLSRENF